MASMPLIRGLPPSPALSETDSLANIDDLDAYLSSQGPLSMFPTPAATKSRPLVNAVQTSCPITPPLDGNERDTSLRERATAHALAFLQAVQPDVQVPHDASVKCISGLIRLAALPQEIMAIAYMIASSYACLIESPTSSPELSIAACLILADAYNNDHPWCTKYWHSLLDKTESTLAQLNAEVAAVLQQLDWSLHPYCDSAAMSIASRLLDDCLLCPGEVDRIDTSFSSTACWTHGQLTPCESEMSSPGL